eukprot:13655311-Ditylum_brightwellii.AAC.1
MGMRRRCKFNGIRIMVSLSLNMSMMRSFWQQVHPELEDLMSTRTSNYVRRRLFRNELNQNQHLIHDLV